MKKYKKPTTSISTSTSEAIYVRGKNLVDELVGHVTFTEMMLLSIMKRMPTKQETAIVDAVLVILMEHGMTPSALAARMTYASSPEALQGAVAAGVLGVGSNFVGTMEGAAKLLQELVDDPEGIEAAARQAAMTYKQEKKPLPGFGHPLHKPDDPRTPRLLAVAEAQNVPGTYIGALRSLSAAVDQVFQKHITINVTGGIAAVLLEIGIPWNIMRGFAVISRAAGVVGHIREEQDIPAGLFASAVAARAVAYEENNAS